MTLSRAPFLLNFKSIAFKYLDLATFYAIGGFSCALTKFFEFVIFRYIDLNASFGD